MENKEIRRGWRFFRCPDCDHKWKLKTRDCFSPSGEDCPVCGGWATPNNYVVDVYIPADRMGNLIK
jgi:hypothetical protein